MKKENKNKKVIIIVMVLLMIVIAACVCVMAAEGKNRRKDKKGATPTDATVADAVTENTMTEDVTTEKITTEDTGTTTEDAGTEEKTSTEATTEVAVSGAGTESTKPQTTEKPKTTESSKPQTTQASVTTQTPATTQAQTAGCQHDWVAQTKVVHHEAEYEEEQIPIEETHSFCNVCGKDLTVSGESDIQHSEASGTFMFNAGTEENPDWWEFYNCAGSHTGPAIVGYETKKYKVKDAWDETVITGYKCSKCGTVR